MAVPPLRAGAILAARRRLGPAALPWRLHCRPVCGSTERELETWLATGAEPPLAVISRRQRFGHGQRGRPWSSPAGGVWLSAALPWPEQPEASAAPGLAVAVGLARELEALGLEVRMKWPNDLLVAERKLAGLLPRLVHRGARIRLARVGVGLNGSNRVPAGAIALAEALGSRGTSRSHPAAAAAALAARVLRGLEWAVARAGEPELVRREAEVLLRLPQPPLWHGNGWWQPEGLSRDGGLRLRCGTRADVLQRSI